MTATEEIKARLNLEDIVAETVKLRRSGRSLSGFCPFHPNTRTPAFVVFPESGTWRCFGQCNEGGDIFKYIMKREGMDFSQALKYLADRAGVQLTPPSPEQERARQVGDRLGTVLEQAVQFYRAQLRGTPAGKAVLEYLHQRGLNDPVLEAFGIGFAPDAWDSLQQFLQQKGVPEQTLLDCGLLSSREGGGTYDRFRNRIMIPIRSSDGQMVGFGARVVDPTDIPKFLNSPQTAVFDKGRLLFGLDRARKSIRGQDQAVIVEGYLDVIALHQAGFTNTVSPMGTALTEDQLRLLGKSTRRIILALDSDAAGEKATLRGLELAREALDRGAEVRFDIRGLMHHERRLQADIRVTTLPAGEDPDDVVNRSPEEWQGILSRAAPLVVHVMETLVRSRPAEDPRVKDEIARQVLPLIEDVPSPVERDDYRQRLARLLRVSEDSFLGITPAARTGTLPSRGRRSADPAPRSPVQAAAEPGYEMERHSLAVLVTMPDLLYHLDRLLRQTGLEKLSAGDFSDSEHASVFAAIQEALAQQDSDPFHYVQTRLGEERFMDLLAVTDSYNQDKINEDDLVLDLFRTLIRLRQKRCRDSLIQLRFLQEEQQGGNEEAAPFQDQVLLQSQLLNRLTFALRTSLAKKPGL